MKKSFLVFTVVGLLSLASNAQKKEAITKPTDTPPPTHTAPVSTDEKTLVDPKPAQEKKVEKIIETAETTKTESSTREQKSKFGFHLGLGLPHPFTAGLDYQSPNDKLGFSLVGGGYQNDDIGDKVKVQLSNVEIQFRFHPWASSFYAGVGAGTHTLKAEKSETISGQSIRAEASVTAGYVTPQIGWLKIYDSGLSLGFQLGVLVPSKANTDVTTNADAAVKATQEYKDLEKDVKDKGDQGGNTTLPFLTLIRVGWMF